MFLSAEIILGSGCEDQGCYLFQSWPECCNLGLVKTYHDGRLPTLTRSCSFWQGLSKGDVWQAQHHLGMGLWAAGPRRVGLVPTGSFHLENQALTQAAIMTLSIDLLLLLTVGIPHGWRRSLKWEMFPFCSEGAWGKLEKGQGGEEKKWMLCYPVLKVLKSLKWIFTSVLRTQKIQVGHT